MKIVLSRKGFDSGSGGGPSPIVTGCPVSLPIPGPVGEPWCYADLTHPLAGPLAPLAAAASKGRIDAETPAHADPVLPLDPGPAVLGQHGAAQAHLENQGVGSGDLFVFFGLFATRDVPPHHRIFAMMRIERVIKLGPQPAANSWRKAGLSQPHPHCIRQDLGRNNALWLGHGRLARNAAPALRLSNPGASPSDWRVPEWMAQHGLSYHQRKDRWGAVSDGQQDLRAVARGQEFVCDVGGSRPARAWCDALWSQLGQAPD